MYHQSIMENFTPIGATVAEISVTRQGKNSDQYILPIVYPLCPSYLVNQACVVLSHFTSAYLDGLQV